ncbi:MAG: type III secretion protein [Pseudomonas proteolytica]|uniref:type III secretion protein n=1 Tax=Pseudomonas proteolytica TaxID=219574 RepID=UPI003F313A87
MKALITNWLNSRDEELRLTEEHDEILLHRGSDTLLLQVQLTRDRPDKSHLNTWIHLGHASLSHFQGALAQAPATGTLWLTQCLQKSAGEKPLLDSLEALLNQRDTWRAMIARLAKHSPRFQPTSLRSLPH